MTLVDDAEGPFGVDGQAQVACQTVAGATGNDAQCRLGVGQRAGNLVDGAVATYGYDDVATLGSARRRNLGCMTSIFGEDNLFVEAVVVERLSHELWKIILRVCARYGVDDEGNERLFLCHVMQKYEKSAKREPVFA